MRIEAFLSEWWQSDDDPIDCPCPVCYGDGVACEATLVYDSYFQCYVVDGVEARCPRCGGTGVYDAAWEALLDLPADALAAYLGAAWDADADRRDTDALSTDSRSGKAVGCSQAYDFSPHQRGEATQGSNQPAPCLCRT